MKVGFTGTRTGMTLPQRYELLSVIQMLKCYELHHGDCLGADKEAHEIVRRMIPTCRICIHPPTYNKFRAFCGSDYIFKELPYLDRNRMIVDCSDILVAAPEGFYEERLSGTWYTVRYARKQKVDTIIVLPDGSRSDESCST